MPAIWRQEGSGWALLKPVGFPKEKVLQQLIDDAPQLLPLEGVPQLAVVGREVRLGSGYADLIAVEPAGRVVVIEVKLKENQDASRGVVSQVLSYAAVLRGMSSDQFETDTLAGHLKGRGYSTLWDAVRGVDQEGAATETTFRAGLDDSLASGRFRLVLVLDDAPRELFRLVGYLEAMAPGLIIDLITVAAYDVGGTQIIVPRRVEPVRETEPTSVRGWQAASSAYYVADGGKEFRLASAGLPDAKRIRLEPLVAWAEQLEADGLAKLYSYHGPAHFTLLPRLPGEEAGPITIWETGTITAYRGVLERTSPATLASLDEHLGKPVGRGTLIRPVDDALLALLRQAFVEARQPG